MKKAAPLSAGLVAIKGTAAPVPDMPTRSAVVEPLPAKNEDAGTEPLNFRVSPAFRTTFKTYAAAHNLKLKELLVQSFEAYRKQQGD